MKKFFRLTTIILCYFVILGMCNLSVNADDFLNNEYEYEELENGTLNLTKYIGSSSNIVIPDSINGKIVTKVSSSTFQKNSNIKSIFISRNITILGEPNQEWLVFGSLSGLEAISVDTENKFYSSVDGVLFNKDNTKLIFYPMLKKQDIYTVPSTVNELSKYAFSNLPFLKQLKFSSKLKKVNNRAIYACQLEEAEYPVYDKPNEVMYLFEFCQSLNKVYIDKNVSWINEGDFYGSPVTLLVFDNSYGLEWAITHNFKYEIISDSQIDIKFGDVDSDGEININDATTIQNFLAENLNLDERSKKCADVDCDGDITIRDVTVIQLYIAKCIDSF